jgi:hypothetical protein
LAHSHALQPSESSQLAALAASGGLSTRTRLRPDLTAVMAVLGHEEGKDDAPAATEGESGSGEGEDGGDEVEMEVEEDNEDDEGDEEEEHMLVRSGAERAPKKRKARVVNLGVNAKDSSLLVVNEKGDRIKAFDGVLKINRFFFFGNVNLAAINPHIALSNVIQASM